MYVAGVGRTCGSPYRTNSIRAKLLIPDYVRVPYLQSACIGMESIDLTSLDDRVLLKMKYSIGT